MDEVNQESLTYEDIIKDSVFVGEIPFSVILESLETQFEDYINMEDNVNYVDIFYKQYNTSYDLIKFDDTEDHPQEKLDILIGIYEKFTDKILELFDKRLAISITPLGDDTIDEVSDQYIIDKLYTTFIINGKSTLLDVISTNVIRNITTETFNSDSEYFDTINRELEKYSPLITDITPTEFLETINASEILDWYEDGTVVGNFLRKYTPKLYQNEEYQVDIINAITLEYQLDNQPIGETKDVV